MINLNDFGLESLWISVFHQHPQKPSFLCATISVNRPFISISRGLSRKAIHIHVCPTKSPHIQFMQTNSSVRKRLRSPCSSLIESTGDLARLGWYEYSIGRGTDLQMLDSIPAQHRELLQVSWPRSKDTPLSSVAVLPLSMTQINWTALP